MKDYLNLAHAINGSITNMNTKITSKFYIRERDREKFRKTIIPKKERKTVGVFCASALLYFEENNSFENSKKLYDYVNTDPSGLNTHLRNYSFSLKSVHSYMCYFFWNPTKESLEDMDHSLDDLKRFFSYLNPKDGFNTNDYKLTNELISNIIGFSRFKGEKIAVDTKWNLITSNSSLTTESNSHPKRKHSLPDSEEKSNSNQVGYRFHSYFEVIWKKYRECKVIFKTTTCFLV